MIDFFMWGKRCFIFVMSFVSQKPLTHKIKNDGAPTPTQPYKCWHKLVWVIYYSTLSELNDSFRTNSWKIFVTELKYLILTIKHVTQAHPANKPGFWGKAHTSNTPAGIKIWCWERLTWCNLRFILQTHWTETNDPAQFQIERLKLLLENSYAKKTRCF